MSATASFGQPKRGLLDFVGAALCLWAAAYHTPVGALVRDLGGRVFNTRVQTRPLLAYYTGGVYDAQDIVAPTPVTAPVPDSEVVAAVPPGRAMGRGVFAAVSRPGTSREALDALAARYQLAATSPEAAALVVERAATELGSEDAAVLAAFAGYDVAAFAVRRVTAEGRAPTLEALALRLPPSAVKATTAASSALMLGTAYGLSWPVAPGTRVSSPFGYRQHPILGRGQFHTGVDLAVPEGTEVKATADGVVRRASEDAVNGKVVIVDHGRGVTTAYCHNSRLRVVTGQPVKAGDVLADSGSTGRSTGPHLHYQLELAHTPMDPFAFRGSQPLIVELPPRPQPAVTTGQGGKDALKRAFERVAAPPESEE
jgi:murein DD-endopeptidase MepM/ murein hydrolase activator NlpD